MSFFNDEAQPPAWFHLGYSRDGAHREPTCTHSTPGAHTQGIKRRVCAAWFGILHSNWSNTHTHHHHLSSPPNANRAATPAALLIEGDSNQRRRSQARLWLRRAAGLNQRKWWRGEQIRVWTGTWQPAAGAKVAQREHRASLWTHFTVHYATATQLHPLHLLPLFLLTHSILPFTASVPFN